MDGDVSSEKEQATTGTTAKYRGLSAPVEMTCLFVVAVEMTLF